MKYHVTVKTNDGKEVKSWGVFPVGETKILDGIYDPIAKELSLLFDSVTERYTTVPVEANGKVSNQLRKMDTYYKFQLPEEDIPAFMEKYVDNNFEFVPESKIITDVS